MKREDYIIYILQNISTFTPKELERMPLETLIIIKVQIELKKLGK